MYACLLINCSYNLEVDLTSILQLADKNVTYKQMELDFIEIEYLYIYSDIQLTHGVTIIKAKVTNTHQTNLKQIRFILALPIEAIISNFTL